MKTLQSTTILQYKEPVTLKLQYYSKSHGLFTRKDIVHYIHITPCNKMKL